METYRVFISFSSKDIKFVREIMSGLKSQNIDFWDYSDEIQQIEAGDEITERLKKEIEKCDFFIPLVSKYSIDPKIGKFTWLEVDYAIQVGLLENKKIIPVELITDVQLHYEYQGPYKNLENILHESFELGNVSSYIKMLKGICNRLNQLYIPQIKAHPRLPFWKLFRDEVIEMAHSNRSHVELMTILGEFNENFKNNNWQQSRFLISHFISTCQYKIPGYKIFYPLIVKAVCEQELGLIDEAWNSYLQADKIKPHDENIYGGLGSICMQKRDFEKAEEYFRKSLEYCPVGKNRDERINHIISLIELGKKISDSDKEFIFNLDLSSFSENELTKIYNVQIALNYHTDNFSAVISIFKVMEKNNLQDTTSIIYYHQCQKVLINLSEAENILLSAIQNKDVNKSYDKTLLYHYLSDFYLEHGRVKEAIRIYKEYLLQPKIRTRQLMVKCARIYKNTGKYSLMKKVCEKMLSGKLFPVPKEKEDFYYDGFAWYLLGNKERANYDYERSTDYDLYYSEYES